MKTPTIEHDSSVGRNTSATKSGWVYGITAYVLWGGITLYWPLLEPANPVEILAHRVLWSCITLGILVVIARRTRHFIAIFRNKRAMLLLGFGSIAVSLTWLLNIWGINTGQVIEVSVGSFINPLMTVLLGVVVLRERVSGIQWIAMGIAAAAVVVITLGFGQLPWLALLVAFFFALYGLLKKLAGVEAIESLAYETVVVAPLALAYLILLTVTGASTFTSQGWPHTMLLIASGIVTAAPLLFFGASTVRISMVSLGLIQYIAPIIQFLLGIFWFHEELTVGRWIGIALVWVALIVFTIDAVLHNRRQLRLTAEASAL